MGGGDDDGGDGELEEGVGDREPDLHAVGAQHGNGSNKNDGDEAEVDADKGRAGVRREWPWNIDKEAEKLTYKPINLGKKVVLKAAKHLGAVAYLDDILNVTTTVEQLRADSDKLKAQLGKRVFSRTIRSASPCAWAT